MVGRAALLITATAALLTAACATEEVDTVLTIEDFDRRCAYDDECVQVFPGDVCGCNCDPAAIALGQQDEWNAERSRLESHCDDIPDCAACPPAEAICVGWGCQIQ